MGLWGRLRRNKSVHFEAGERAGGETGGNGRGGLWRSKSCSPNSTSSVTAGPTPKHGGAAPAAAGMVASPARLYRYRSLRTAPRAQEMDRRQRSLRSPARSVPHPRSDGPAPPLSLEDMCRLSSLGTPAAPAAADADAAGADARAGSGALSPQQIFSSLISIENL